MSDDDEEYDIATDETRRKARRALDDAVTAYAQAINTDDETILGGIGGWIISIFSPTTEEGRDAYVVESSEGQPWHCSVGLARYAVSHYEES